MRILWQLPGRWRYYRTWAKGLAFGSLLLARIAAAQDVPIPVGSALAPGTFRLTVTDSTLSLEAREASVAAICAAIGQRTEIEIVLHRGADQTITTHFAQVPLREAFQRLAPNIVIVETHGPQAPPHRIAKVYVLQAGQSGGSPQPQAANAPQAVAQPEPFKFEFDPSQPGRQPQ